VLRHIPHRQPTSAIDHAARLGGRRHASQKRKAAAIIELAVCLPLLVLVTLGTIEACAMLFLKQTLAIAAFEGARLGVVPGSESFNVEAQSQLILTDHAVQGYSISMEPADPRTLSSGDYMRVTVTAPCAPNSLIGGWFYTNTTFSESAELAYY
jgi:hypothetical protein